MPSKTKTALAALFILGPVSVVRSHRRRQSCRDGTHECVSSLRSLLNIGINTARARSPSANGRRRTATARHGPSACRYCRNHGQPSGNSGEV